MFARNHLTVPLVALALGIASHAAADIAPPDDYVEKCTVAKKLTTASECLECESIHTEEDLEGGESADRCVKLLSSYCYTRVCNAWGATAHAEVWCRTKDAGAMALPESIANQMNSYDAPTLLADTGAAGAANCAAYTPPPQSGSGSDTGCSLLRTTSAKGTASLGFLVLLGLMLMANRKKSGKSKS